MRGAAARLRGAASLLAVPLAVAAAGCASVTSRAAMPTNLDRPFVAGYHPYWAGDAWTAYPFDVLDELYYFELEVSGEGGILDAHGWPGAWTEMVRRARSAGAQVVPTLSMHDPEAFEVLFSDAGRVDRLVGTVIDLVATTPAISGVHLDIEVFEPVVPAARDGYTAFVARLARRLRDEHPALSLSVFTLAFDFDDVYNEAAIGQIADFVVVQGYDYASAESLNAGPVGALGGPGALTWEAALRRYDALGVPRGRIVMSVPLYGYEWPVISDEPRAATRGPGVTIPYSAPDSVLPALPRALAQASRHGVRRDGESGSPYYVYRDGDGWRQGWYEDAESLRAKYDFVRANGLGGVALFPLAYGTEDLWRELRAAFGGSR